MSEQGNHPDRVNFSRGFAVCIMAIDGTWRRDCQLNAISDDDATLTVEGSIQGSQPGREFFLLLSSTGLAYRRCELVRVNGFRDRHPVPQGQGQEAQGRAVGPMTRWWTPRRRELWRIIRNRRPRAPQKRAPAFERSCVNKNRPGWRHLPGSRPARFLIGAMAGCMRRSLARKVRHRPLLVS